MPKPAPPLTFSRRAFTMSTLAAAAFPVLSSAQVSSPALYDPEDLGSLNGYGEFKAIAINQFGQTIGNADNNSRLANEGFVWTPNGSGGPPENPCMRTLGNLSGRPAWLFNGSLAAGINASGQIVGMADGPEGLIDTEHACLWQPTGGTLDLGTLTDRGLNSMATAINNIGKIVGWSDTEPGTLDWYKHRHAFVYDIAARRMHDLRVNHSEANDVNDWNEIVGSYDVDETHQHAVYWHPNGNAYDLHYWIGGGGSWSKAVAVNDRGQVVGWTGDPDGRGHHAFIADLRSGAVRHLPHLNSERESRLYAINNRGQAVGVFKANVFSYHALLVDAATGAAADLNSRLPVDQQWPQDSWPHRRSGWLLKEAWDINDAGQIAGTGTHSIEGTYYGRAFRLLPRAA